MEHEQSRIFLRPTHARVVGIDRVTSISVSPELAVYVDAIAAPFQGNALGGRPTGGLLSSTGQILHGRVASYGGEDDCVSPELDDAIPYLDEDVIWLSGTRFRAFGHLITEDLSRVWWVIQNPGDRRRLVFLSGSKAHNRQRLELLSLLGIDPARVLTVDTTTRFRTVAVPDQALYLDSGSLDPERMGCVYDALRVTGSAVPGRRVYLTHRGYGNRHPLKREFGEEFLEEFYRAQGFAVVAPEDLALGELLRLMASAEHVATPLATTAHFVAFCQDGVKFDMIQREGRSHIDIQWSLLKMRNADWMIVDPLLDFLPSGPNAGVKYFSPTPEWADYVAQRFEVDGQNAPSDTEIIDYIRQWYDYVESAPDLGITRLGKFDTKRFLTELGHIVRNRDLPAARVNRLLS